MTSRRTAHPYRALLVQALGCLAAALACLAAACGDDEPGKAPLWFPDGIAVGEHFLLVDAEADEAFILDGERPGVVATTGIAANPLWLGQREGHDDGLILSSGRRGVAEGGVLTLVRATGRTRTYPLSAPFNRVSQTEDGRFAVLFFEQGASNLTFSPNDIAVVDLDEGDADRAITHKTLRTPLGALSTLVASPQLRIGGERAHIAVAVSAGYLSIVDLESPDHPDILVQLGGRGVLPDQVLFSQRRGETYVRARGSDDAFILTFDQASDERDNRIWPTIDQVAIGSGFADMVIAGGDDSGQLLATTPSTDKLHLVDIETATTTPIEIETGASRLVRFRDGQDEDDPGWVIAFAPGAFDIRLIDPTKVADDPLSAIAVIETDAAVDSIEVLEARGQALLFHADSTMSVLAQGTTTLQRISINTDLSSVHLDDGIGQMVVATPGQHLLSVVDLDGGASEEVLLDAPIDFVVPVADAGRLAVVHADGTVSLVDLERPRRATVERLIEFR